jgi:hypothetical protein
MSKMTRTVLVEARGADVLRRCQATLGSLGWEVTRDDEGVVTVREDVAALCCNEAPASARLQIEPRDGGISAVEITARVPGIGPVSSRHVRSRMALLERVVARDPARRAA